MGYEKEKRPLLQRDDSRLTGIAVSTAPSTAVRVGGVVALETSSTAAFQVYTLQTPKAGDVIEIGATLAGATSFGFHINSTPAVFGAVEDMATLSTAGAGFRAVARSSSQWIVTGVRNAVFSTST